MLIKVKILGESVITLTYLKSDYMAKLLWLDDYRDPMEGQWLVFSPIKQEDYEVHWVKSYKEFIEWIQKNGLPTGICFDHDLSDFQAFYNGYPEKLKEALETAKEVGRLHIWEETLSNEKTGMDCVKWLVDYCIDNNKPLPLYNIQSANPVGKENMDTYLKNYLKSLKL